MGGARGGKRGQGEERRRGKHERREGRRERYLQGKKGGGVDGIRRGRQAAIGE